ncbi:PREDICTED: uncharacterized protein LOC104827472 [Tarenaya hassleriana]|uniref:uncharacterized protein LOC104827472 n=1 Tax=Tarenaya hassleriana TaxID=28532 RepID=UPI00053C6FB7|nr:PREDICTED: uncharacterized protein LOC104827472 [Tarenaya hassleriana]
MEVFQTKARSIHPNHVTQQVVHHLLLLLLLALSLFVNQKVACVSALNYTKYRHVSSLRLERIQKHLNNINKPPVLTIQSADGDIIDCVHKRKQPALDHPLLKNHRIQKGPSKWPKKKMRGKGAGDVGGDLLGGAWQIWHVNGTRCPKGTVPIRRSTLQDVLRAESLFDFGKKTRRVDLNRRSDIPDVIGSNGHEVHLICTPDLNSIEAGWQVSPELYGDSRPRLFTYWTSDSYQATGCYNLLCAGFIQTNNRIAIGAAISPISTFKGNQFDITILIWKDPKLGNWWLGFGDNTLVGYWPSELFTRLSGHATMVEWGGEVVNSRATGRHTTTQMGSGHFAVEGFEKASYFRNLETVDPDNTLVPVRSIQTLSENSNCYNIQSFYSNDWGTYFYYGGPGFNPKCT